MNRIELDNDNYLQFQPTPWDAEVFGYQTIEIVNIQYNNVQKLDQLLPMLDEYFSGNITTLCFLRINSSDRQLKFYIQKHGFYYVETSFIVTIPQLKTHSYNVIVKKMLTLSVPDEADFHQIKMIASDSFDHSRFHEDPTIDQEKARKRFYNWIDNMRNQQKAFLVYKTGAKVISFLAYEITNNVVDLILAGSAKEDGLISYYFWPSVLAHFKSLNVRKVKAVISASNLGIVNLYVGLNFTFEKTLIGYHKFYKQIY